MPITQEKTLYRLYYIDSNQLHPSLNFLLILWWKSPIKVAEAKDEFSRNWNCLNASISEDVRRKNCLCTGRWQRILLSQIDIGTERIWSFILQIRRKQPAWYICKQNLPRKRKNSWSFTVGYFQNYKVLAG